VSRLNLLPPSYGLLSNVDGHLTDVEDEDGDGLNADQINKKLEFAHRRQSVSRVVLLLCVGIFLLMHFNLNAVLYLL
jgi:hypothetical protein